MTVLKTIKHDPSATHSGYRAGLDGVMTGQESEDEAAIKTTCYSESWAAKYGDPDMWQSCWLHADHCTFKGVLRGTGLQSHRGWTEIAKHVLPLVEGTSNGARAPIPFDHIDYEITTDGDLAWVSFTELNWHASDLARKKTIKVENHRVLQRVEGQWKLAHMIWIVRKSLQFCKALVRLDRGGQVLNASKPLTQELKGSGLTISAGRLRATQPMWDKGLQSTIQRLADATNMLEACNNEVELQSLGTGLPAELPVLLGEDETGGQRYCMVCIEDGALIVSIDDAARLDSRLAAANLVYGLSAAQLRLSREIIAGLSLPAAAEKLGISPTTARTHLNRIFDKTGVSNQAALVRCLLTVGG